MKDTQVSLTLANGMTWGLIAKDNPSRAILAHLKKTMQLYPIRPPTHHFLMSTSQSNGSDLGWESHQHQLEILVDRKPIRGPENLYEERWMKLSQDEKDRLHCTIPKYDHPDAFISRVMQVSDILVIKLLNAGGVLVHGALVERDGRGFILAGSGGVGKTTASTRMPAPWRARCDDLTLVVRDRYGIYWAHPWPTWSRFLHGGEGGSWDVQNAVPLSAMFVLAQSGRDQVQVLDEVEALCILVEHTQHSGITILRGLEEERKREIQLQRFDNLCALVNMVPCYRLWITLEGAFWLELEREVLDQEVLQQVGMGLYPGRISPSTFPSLKDGR